MKIITSTNRGLLLGLGLLGASTLAGFATPASAQPRRDRDNRQDVKQARKEVREARKNVRRAGTPEDRRDAREDLRQEREDLREERRENRRPGYSRPGYGYGRPSNGQYRPGYQGQYRPGYQNGGGNYGGYQNGSSNYTGIVTRVTSNQSFDVRIGGNTFNVYTNGRLPQGLSTGDTVQVNGVQEGKNDIRNASVSLISNR